MDINLACLKSNSKAPHKILIPILLEGSSLGRISDLEQFTTENNSSTVSNESEYFITDIELADTELGARIDILALRWKASERKSNSKLCPVLIEMKYGDKALGGSAGMSKYLKDMDALVSNPDKYQKLRETLEVQFNQMHKLGLYNFNEKKNWKEITIDTSTKPELIFILANYNPRSSKLNTILEDAKSYEDKKFDLRFFVSSFAGYAMHTENMLSLGEFREVVKNLKKTKED